MTTLGKAIFVFWVVLAIGSMAGIVATFYYPSLISFVAWPLNLAVAIFWIWRIPNEPMFRK